MSASLTPMRSGPSALTVRLSPVRDRQALIERWQALEAEADVSFFQSSLWLGTWLACFHDATTFQLLEVHDGDRPVGLALLGAGHRPALGGLLRRPLLLLSETGVPALDRLTVEHNGPLAARGYAAQVADALASLLQQRRAPWREVVLSGLDEEPAELLARIAADRGLLAHTVRRVPCPYVDLGVLRGAAAGDCGSGDYLASLSTNARHQVRRSERIAAQDGPVRLQVAGEASTARAWLAELIELHQVYWRARGEPGAFADARVVAFHQALLDADAALEHIWLARLEAGAHTLGVLYGFRHRGALLSYQSGFAYREDARFKPGLLAHSLAAQWALDAGLDRYDFLAGDDRYKRSLANGADTLRWLVLSRADVYGRMATAVRLLRAAVHVWAGGGRR